MASLEDVKKIIEEVNNQGKDIVEVCRKNLIEDEYCFIEDVLLIIDENNKILYEIYYDYNTKSYDYIEYDTERAKDILANYYTLIIDKKEFYEKAKTVFCLIKEYIKEKF